jgi:hypothetical protein
MKSLLWLALALPAAACAAHVTHPSKSAAEMDADVAACQSEANERYWMDPVAALYNAYDCLEAKGYQRDEKDLAARVDRAFGSAPAKKREPARPCRVPCRRQR